MLSIGPIARRLLLAHCFAVASLCLIAPTYVLADDIAQFKVVKGSVHIERGGQRVPVRVGTHLQATDTVVTSADGAAGITFIDNSLLSMGPNSVLAIERYAFNSTTHEGSFESSLRKGTLSVYRERSPSNLPTQ